MNAKELREKSEEELLVLLGELGRERFNLRMQAGFGQLSKPDQMKKVRRDVARIKTVLGEKARAAS